MRPGQTIADRLDAVRSRVTAAAERAGRSPKDVTLLAASKFQSVEDVCLAVRAGLCCLGENYVQEAAEKQPAVCDRLEELSPSVEAPRWHMIGALQSNKARLAVELFDLIETLDRPSLAIEIDKRARGAGKIMDAFVQVNLSAESQKAGIEESTLRDLLARCRPLENLRITGLMTIPAAKSDPNLNRSVFAKLRELRDVLREEPGGAGLQELSMGMSQDFEIAIEEGATVIRVGSALFGPRPEKS